MECQIIGHPNTRGNGTFVEFHRGVWNSVDTDTCAFDVVAADTWLRN